MLYLSLTGRIGIASMVLFGLLPLLARWRALGRMWRNAAGPSPGQQSEVTTRFLRMSLDHDTGLVSGVVLDGPFRGRTLQELTGAEATVYAREGFNLIATANTRDRGVNEMSAALKRRFNFETVFPIPDFDTELALVEAEATRLLARSGVTVPPRPDVLEVLVTTFRELRAGMTERGDTMERLTTVMSTAEAVSVAHAIGLRGWFLRGEAGQVADIVPCLAGTAVKDNLEDLTRLRRYLEQQVSWRKGRHWQALYNARHLLPG